MREGQRRETSIKPSKMWLWDWKGNKHVQSSASISGGHSCSETDVSMSTSMALNRHSLFLIGARVSFSKKILFLHTEEFKTCIYAFLQLQAFFFFKFLYNFSILNPTLPLGQLFCCISCSPVVLASNKWIIFNTAQNCLAAL